MKNMKASKTWIENEKSAHEINGGKPMKNQITATKTNKAMLLPDKDKERAELSSWLARLRLKV